MRTAANLTNSTEWQKAFLLCPVKWHCTHIINANCIAHIPVMQVIGIGILPNDCDTLAFIGQGHSSRRTQTHARSSSSCDGVLIIQQQQINVCLKQQ
jgi:hypothetical protein